ncbi:MAG: TonB-dependent receptor, partial [bacterium]|nr:TonB-dependent receptor [bacterium]
SKIPPGTYTLRASRVGYKEVILKDVRIDSETDQHFKLIMTPIAHQLKEITVTPGTFSFMETGSAARQTMSREDIESVPQFGEDIFRAVNRLPGLSSGDFSAHFSIRGGRHDETLIVLDGLEIYEPYHLKDFNEGAISIIDAETIEGVELMTGGFPAAYGNRISGVFNMTSRKSRVDRPKYSVGLSFMYARAKAEGTFAQNKGSWLFSARRGYLDLVFTIMRQNDLPSPKYYDIFGKIDYELNPRHNLSVNLLRAGDKYSYNANGTTGFKDTINTKEIANNRYGNSYAWVTLKSALGQRASVRTMASAGLVTKDRDGAEQYTNIPDAVYALTNKRDFTILGLKQDWAYELSNSIFLETGIDFKRVDADDNFTNYVGRNPDDPTADATGYYPVETRTTFKKNGTLLGLYLSNRFQILDPFTLELGGRYDRASYTKDSDFSPRVNALFKLAESSNLRLGWGTYRQMQSIEDVTVLNGQDRYSPSERSRQWTAGFEHGFVNGAKLRVEGYYKRGSNLRPTYRNWVSAPDIFPETNEDRILVYPDKSTSRGMEVYFTQNIGKKLSIRGSYALAKVEEQVSRVDNVNDPLVLQFDRKHPNPQDQRHALNLDCTYRPNDAWSINLSYAFHAGWPATLQGMFEVTGDDGQKDFAVRPLKLYGGKLPAYQRLDVRATKRFSTSRGDVRFFFEVVNLTNHSNVFAYDYFKVRSNNGDFRLERDIEKWFIILPSIGISWSGGF